MPCRDARLKTNEIELDELFCHSGFATDAKSISMVSKLILFASVTKPKYYPGVSFKGQLTGTQKTVKGIFRQTVNAPGLR